ncbi:MAG: anaerobic ribonucleoside-triphosphate reductase activating protein [Patescibacteria group bacterium]|jgi:pyruvate formate lyase activating enzyme
MKIGGLQKFSLLDYPGKISAIIFTKGCNFRCHYCYNPMLVEPKGGRVLTRRQGKVVYSSPDPAEPEELSSDNAGKGEGQEGHPLKEGDLFVFLKKRIGKLDAVVITGGEPTIQPDLPEFLAKIKELGFLIKLDTNGSSPEMLKKILDKNLADYIAMDLKTSLPAYEKACGVKFDLEKLKKSIKMIKESSLPREWRTTLVPGIVEADDISALGKLIKGESVWYLQGFKSQTPLVNNEFQGKNGYSAIDMEKMRKIALGYVKKCEIR